MKKLPYTVFPSDQQTITVSNDKLYCGAHLYHANNCLGFNDGKTEYEKQKQEIRFVRKDDDGNVISGLQSEQLLLILIDRHKKLNDRFPSREGALAITKMEEALHWLEARVRERLQREVMGELKK